MHGSNKEWELKTSKKVVSIQESLDLGVCACGLRGRWEEGGGARSEKEKLEMNLKRNETARLGHRDAHVM